MEEQVAFLNGLFDVCAEFSPHSRSLRWRSLSRIRHADWAAAAGGAVEGREGGAGSSLARAGRAAHAEVEQALQKAFAELAPTPLAAVPADGQPVPEFEAPVPAMRHGAPSWAPPAMLPTSGVDADPASTSMAQRLVFDMPSTLSEDTAPSASLDHLKAQAAPAQA